MFACVCMEMVALISYDQWGRVLRQIKLALMNKMTFSGLLHLCFLHVFIHTLQGKLRKC